MKILFVHYSIYQKERWGRIYPLAKAAAKCGLEVTLLTTDIQKGFSYSVKHEDGVNIIIYKDIISHKLLKRGFALFSLLSRVIHVLFNRYDFVYIDCGEAPNTGWIGKIAQWKGAVLLSEWGDLLGKGGFYDTKPKLFKILYGWYYLWAELYFRKSADFIIVLSSAMRDHAIKRGVFPEKIKLVPGGSISDLVAYGYKNKNLLGLSEDVITFGYIGIDDGEIKDLKPLIKVLKKDKYRDKIKLVTFGNKLSDKTIEYYQLEDLIVNCGWINFYKDYSLLQCVDVYILMKSVDINRSGMGWPNKLGDYMAIGRPVLLNLYGDIEIFVNQHPAGFIPVELSLNNIENRIDEIVKGTYNLREMGYCNRKIAENEISWEARVEKLLSEIQKRD